MNTKQLNFLPDNPDMDFYFTFIFFDQSMKDVIFTDFVNIQEFVEHLECFSFYNESEKMEYNIFWYLLYLKEHLILDLPKNLQENFDILDFENAEMKEEYFKELIKKYFLEINFN